MSTSWAVTIYTMGIVIPAVLLVAIAYWRAGK